MTIDTWAFGRRTSDGTTGLIAALVLGAAVAVPLHAARAEDAPVDKMRAKIGAFAEKAIAQQGGSRMVFKVDAGALRDRTVNDLRDDLYRIVHDGRIPFSGLAIRDGGVEIRITEPKDRDRVLAKLTAPKDYPPIPGSPVTVADAGSGQIRFTPTDAAFAAYLRDLVDRSMTMIDQRLYDIDIKPAGVLPDGADRIRLVLPGVTDPDRVAALFAKKVRVSFRMVDISTSPQDALKDSLPAGSDVLYGFKDNAPWLVLKEGLLDGDDLSDAAPGYDSRTHDPIVSFRFNARGQRRFAHATEENVGKPFAIVLEDKVIAAPVIREPITGGQGQISGNFTVQEASSVASKLVAAALPGRLTLVEQKVVEPGAASR
ncbi:preprotein translocase subunit SecD [Bradyrhizobium sp. CCGUVB1N3]|uniref:SecDF P1 head subdomain-containing protein n=1 Tax=Bradyrhizobium sp. CCGUVB1N3 TaxID=2949629 RepID=UPI0020B441D2|nr:preprotein translocase subunit SecD [Bradyrhizobium sp. CCGUVB1N3]MCP3477355.1 preprotein translocase subunit SecD [Bradyrhizobium sp. CCGUVB1N3]